MRYGLIGCGGIARGHLSAYGHRFELVACCDIREPAADEFQRRFGFRRTYTDFRTMLDTERLDFVTVCTSTTHDRLDIVLACAAAGVHPLVEKPMALTREQARQMVAACAEAGVKLAVSQQYRNFPHVKAACDLLRSGTLGRPFLGELRMAHLGWFPLKGAKPSDYFVKFDRVLLLNGTVHHFDMLRFLVAEEPRRIYTRAGQAPFRTAIGERGDTWSISTVDFPRLHLPGVQLHRLPRRRDPVGQLDARRVRARLAVPQSRRRHPAEGVPRRPGIVDRPGAAGARPVPHHRLADHGAPVRGVDRGRPGTPHQRARQPGNAGDGIRRLRLGRPGRSGEAGTGMIAGRRESLRTTKSEVAGTLGLGKDAFTRSSRLRARKTQARLRQMLEILNRVEAATGSPLAAYA